jgi:hypothetical protein
MTISYNRQLDIFDNDKFNLPVHVVGCGATGSWVCMMLAKLGIKEVHLWDFDIVEEHNIPNQAFQHADINRTKAKACNSLALDFGCMNYVIHEEAVTTDTPLSGIVFILTDTMKSRSEIWKGACKYKTNIPLVIETRMGLDMCRIYNVNPTDLDEIKAYEASFSYDDDAAEVSACGTSKSVVTSAMTTASVAVRQLLNYNNGIKLPNEILYDFAWNNYLCTDWHSK